MVKIFLPFASENNMQRIEYYNQYWCWEFYTIFPDQRRKLHFINKTKHQNEGNIITEYPYFFCFSFISAKDVISGQLRWPLDLVMHTEQSAYGASHNSLEDKR
jgi:hypothetical protein